MGMLDRISRFFFEKRGNAFSAAETLRRNQLRYNALYALDPDVLVRHLTAFAQGDICGLERVLDEFETREDKMRIGAFKMSAAVSSKPWEVRINKGEANSERAKLHQRTLLRFWNRVEVTDMFRRNRKGGLHLLVRQMMSAQSRVFSVHDIVWKVNGDGSLKATFTHVPAWCFENRTGQLRYIRNDGDFRGEEMRDGEWLVTIGEGVGIPAAILAMAKRLGWNDWLLFSEKCGMPVVMGNTSAQHGSDTWRAMERAIQSIAPKTGLLADAGTKLNAVSMGGGDHSAYRELIDCVDRAISALYRGGDLATVSSRPDAAGTNAQDGESELMDADGCAMISETLRDQVERFVIRFECGDYEPLAGIVINPPSEGMDIDREMKIDSHLSGLGVRLSKSDALARYGRIEAKDDSDALEATQNTTLDPFFDPKASGSMLFNAKTAFKTTNAAFKTARKDLDAQGAVSAENGSEGVLEAFCKDGSKAAQEVLKLLEDPTAEKAAELIEKLPSLLPEDPALAAVIAEAMAEEFRVSSSEFEEPPTPTPNSNSLTQQEAEKIWDDIMGDDE